MYYVTKNKNKKLLKIYETSWGIYAQNLQSIGNYLFIYNYIFVFKICYMYKHIISTVNGQTNVAAADDKGHWLLLQRPVINLSDMIHYKFPAIVLHLGVC